MSQPTNQEYHGEIEAAFLKLLMIFIDDKGKINIHNKKKETANQDLLE